MLDRYNRKIHYLRISVTDRCNLRCRYCMPEEGVKLLGHDQILSFEEIARIVKTAVDLGVDKVRLTGGEPLVRKGIVELVGMLAAIPGINDLSMTTNGLLMAEYAFALKQAGLQRVNISLDTMDPDRYLFITRGGDLQKVLQGIEAARAAGLTPVKINCVVAHSSDEPDARAVAAYGRDQGLEVRFIRQMTLKSGQFGMVDGGTGGDCGQCNRLRLTANGMVKPCLFNNLNYDVRALGAHTALQQAVGHKPHSGTKNTEGAFYNIGG